MTFVGENTNETEVSSKPGEENKSVEVEKAKQDVKKRGSLIMEDLSVLD